MTRDNNLGLTLLWKFRTREVGGWVRWHWETWTPSGRFVERSALDYESLSDCEAHARAAGWIPPERRR